MKVYTKEELKEILDKHSLWIKDHSQGEKADLRWANLEGADLRWADLRWADLRGAYPTEADLRGAIGNRNQIKTIQTGKYTVVWTKDKIWVGCKSFTLEEWKNKTESEIAEMHSKALDFYKEWKDILLSMFEKFNNQ